MSFTTTLAPCCAINIAIARPMPRPAPVTMTTLPSTILPGVTSFSLKNCQPQRPQRAQRKNKPKSSYYSPLFLHFSVSSVPSVAIGLNNFRAAVVQYRHPARGDRRAERHDAAVAPDFGADGFAGINRGRETARHAPEARRVVAAAGFENGVAGDAEGAAAVQDRPRVTRFLRGGRFSVQRVVIAREPIDQFRLPQRRQVAYRVRWRRGDRVRRSGRAGRPAEAAVSATETGRRQRAER